MTQEQFDSQKWGAHMVIQHKDGRRRKLLGVDFEERILTLSGADGGELDWWRCENCEIVEADK